MMKMRKTLTATLFALSLLTVASPTLASTASTALVTAPSASTTMVLSTTITPVPNYPEPPDWFD